MNTRFFLFGLLKTKKVRHITRKNPKIMCLTFLYSINNRENSTLLLAFFNGNGNRNGSADHGVVAHTDEGKKMPLNHGFFDF